jgi:hypothetical protein
VGRNAAQISSLLPEVFAQPICSCLKDRAVETDFRHYTAVSIIPFSRLCHVQICFSLGTFPPKLLFNNLKICRNIILPVVLYGCEAWSLKLREERRLKVFENRVLRRVFGSKRDEVTEKRTKLHN